MEAPRVDYLLQNGGLAKAIPRSLLAAIDGVPASAYSQYTTPRLSGAQAHDVRSFFKPLQNVGGGIFEVNIPNRALSTEEPRVQTVSVPVGKGQRCPFTSDLSESLPRRWIFGQPLLVVLGLFSDGRP